LLVDLDEQNFAFLVVKLTTLVNSVPIGKSNALFIKQNY